MMASESLLRWGWRRISFRWEWRMASEIVVVGMCSKILAAARMASEIFEENEAVV